MVVETTAEQPVEPVAPERPEDPGACGLDLELEQRQRRVDGRMPATHHQRGAAGVIGPLRTHHVGNAIGDTVGEFGFAAHRQPADPHRVRPGPGTGSVDHGPRQGGLLGAIRIAPADFERRRLSIAARHLVEPAPGDPRHPCAEPQGAGDRRDRRERPQVAHRDLASGRQGGGLRRLPSLGGEQRPRRGIDIVCPWREHPHMRPFEQRSPHRGAALENHGCQPAGHQLRRCGEADRAGADDRDRKLRVLHDSILLEN